MLAGVGQHLGPVHAHRPHVASADPSAVLVSPDGQALPFSLTNPGRPFRDTLSEVLDTIATSQARTALGKASAEAFGVVLLVEGNDPDKNTRARQAITEAIAEITGQMKAMPKAIAKPHLGTLPAVRALAESLPRWQQPRYVVGTLAVAILGAGWFILRRAHRGP